MLQRNLPFLPTLTCLALGFLLLGCASNGTGASQAATGKQIEIFKDGRLPSKPYSVIGSVTDDARLEEEPAIEAKMKKQAIKMGGDALIFEPKTETGFDVHPWGWGAKKSYLYKANVIKYQ